MANIIDERNEDELLEGEEYAELEDSEEEQPEEQQPEPEEDEEENEVPDKYRGKSVKDIVAMHQNAEQLLGKQGQEVGELRRIVDDFIQAQTVAQQQAAHADSEDFDETEFFSNPKDAVQKLLNDHPAVKQSQELSIKLKQQEAISRLKAEHPDFNTVLADPSFSEWVQKSKIRTRLLKEADANYDFDSADELLTLWKERQGTLKSTVEAEKIQRKQSVKNASTGTSKGSSERPSRKIYRRADIIELMRNDPQRYEVLAPEIRAAYAEGRVK